MKRSDTRRVERISGVHLGRGLERPGIQTQDGIQCGTVIVEGFDPIQVAGHQLPAGLCSRGKAGVDLGYGGLLQDKRRRLGV